MISLFPAGFIIYYLFVLCFKIIVFAASRNFYRVVLVSDTMFITSNSFHPKGLHDNTAVLEISVALRIATNSRLKLHFNVHQE